MRIAPWTDYDGNPIFEGSRIRHPDGSAGTVVVVEADDEADRWRVRYDSDPDKLSRLGLQIGEKGQAVVTTNGERDGRD